MNIQVFFFFLFLWSLLSTEQLPSHQFSLQTFSEAVRPLRVLVLIQKSAFRLPKQHSCPEKKNSTTSANVSFVSQMNVFGKRLWHDVMPAAA